MSLAHTYGALAIASGVFNFAAYFGRRASAARMVPKVTPTVAGVVDGQVVGIVGKVARDQARMVAPGSDRACVGFRADVLTRVVDGGVLREELNAISVVLPSELILELGDRSTVRVDLSKVKANWVPLPVLNAEKLKPVSENVELARLWSQLPEGAPVLADLSRMREALIEEGELLHATGVARWEVDASGDNGDSPYRGAPLRLAIIAGPGPVILSQTPIAYGTLAESVGKSTLAVGAGLATLGAWLFTW